MKYKNPSALTLILILLICLVCERSQDPVGPTRLRGRIVYTEIVNFVFQLFVMQPNDPHNSYRLLNSLTDDLAPRWSPDGTKIAFLSDREGVPGFFRLYMVDDDGTNVHGLFDTVIHPEGDLEFSWAPDGKHIALINKIRGFRNDRRQLFILDVQTLVRQRVADALPNRFVPDWSPDGARIAFLSASLNRPGADLSLLSFPGLQLSTVDVGINRINFPRWSPDGQRLAFVGTPDDTTNFQLYVAEGIALVPRQVTFIEGGIDQPGPLAWSPDGQRIIFSGPGVNVFNRNARDFYAVQIDDSVITRFTSKPNDESAPDWTQHE